MDLTLIGATATFIATFSLLMAIFGPALAEPKRAEAISAVALPRHRYQRLVAADRPAWERLLAPLARRIADRLPGLASQVDERLIVRAGLDPAVLSPAEVYAAKLVAAVGVLVVALALTPLFGGALVLGLGPAYAAYVFPTEYLGWRARRRKAQLLRELPDFLALVRPLAQRHPLEFALTEARETLEECSGGSNLLATQLRRATGGYAIGADLYEGLTDVALANDLEDLEELAAALGQSRHISRKGVVQTLEATERGLRENERNRLLGAASTVQPKLAAILAGIYLPEFVLLVVLPMFMSTLGRL
jgi:Flp pilus assembly protein TadB